MTLVLRVSVFAFLFGASIFHVRAESLTTLPDVAGKWEVSWEGRFGAEHGVLELQQDGGKVTGTFQDVHGLSSLSGNLGENRISLDVHFEGSRPYTIRFSGHWDGKNIQGVSEAVGIGSTGAYLGHGGEVAQPQHPWTAVRVNP